ALALEALDPGLMLLHALAARDLLVERVELGLGLARLGAERAERGVELVFCGGALGERLIERVLLVGEQLELGFLVDQGAVFGVEGGELCGELLAAAREHDEAKGCEREQHTK